MKQTFTLEAIQEGIYTDFRLNNQWFICGDFVKRFLGLDEYVPSKITLTYTNKNPKEKGFKKVDVIHDYNCSLFAVFISGKKWDDVSLYWALERLLKEYGVNTFWVKIKVI